MKKFVDDKGKVWVADDAMLALFKDKLCPCVMPTPDKIGNPEYKCGPCPRLLRGEKDGVKDKCAVYKIEDA